MRTFAAPFAIQNIVRRLFSAANLACRSGSQLSPRQGAAQDRDEERSPLSLVGRGEERCRNDQPRECARKAVEPQPEVMWEPQPGEEIAVRFARTVPIVAGKSS